MKPCFEDKNRDNNYTCPNNVIDMFSIKSCNGVTIKNIHKILSIPPYFRIYTAFFSGIFF